MDMHVTSLDEPLIRQARDLLFSPRRSPLKAVWAAFELPPIAE